MVVVKSSTALTARRVVPVSSAYVPLMYSKCGCSSFFPESEVAVPNGYHEYPLFIERYMEIEPLDEGSFQAARTVLFGRLSVRGIVTRVGRSGSYRVTFANASIPVGVGAGGSGSSVLWASTRLRIDKILKTSWCERIVNGD
jgi:hypothetical protein